VTQVTLYRPDVQEEEVEQMELAPRVLPDGGARLALIDNGKSNARRLLELIAGELGDRFPIAGIEAVSKKSAGAPIDPDTAAAVAARSDLVITAIGDCGACSACSLHDALQFERLGVPATVIISDPFVAHIAGLSAKLGMPGYATVVVPHPVSSKDEEHLRKLARASADAVAANLSPALVPAGV
jgi:hypothetical protein